MIGWTPVLAEPHVSILALLFVVALLSIPQVLAIYFWSKVHRDVDETIRRLAENRASRSGTIVRIDGKEETEEHDPDGESVEYLHIPGAPVEEFRKWGPWPEVPPMRKTPPSQGET